MSVQGENTGHRQVTCLLCSGEMSAPARRGVGGHGEGWEGLSCFAFALALRALLGGGCLVFFYLRPGLPARAQSFGMSVTLRSFSTPPGKLGGSRNF